MTLTVKQVEESSRAKVNYLLRVSSWLDSVLSRLDTLAICARPGKSWVMKEWIQGDIWRGEGSLPPSHAFLLPTHSHSPGLASVQSECVAVCPTVTFMQRSEAHRSQHLSTPPPGPNLIQEAVLPLLLCESLAIYIN